MTNRDDTFMNITNKDVYEKVMEQSKTLNEILEHARLTNGRVNKLECKSIGVWIANNPFKFTVFIIVLLSIIISDFRHPMIAFLASFI